MKQNRLVVSGLLALVLALTLGSAEATAITPNNPTNNQGGQGGSGVAAANASAGVINTVGVVNTVGVNNSMKSDIKNTVNNNQSQAQHQGQLQGQSQAVKNSANNIGSSVVTVEGDTVEASRIPVSSAYAATIFPTAPCMGSSSAGGSGALLSLSVASSWESTECVIGETARGFDQAGYKEDGLAVRCQGKYAKIAPSCIALAKKASVLKPTKVDLNTAEESSANSANSASLVNSNNYYSIVSNPLSRN